MAQKKEEESKLKEEDVTHVVITGANRGIGLEFVRQLIQREGYVVTACCRKPKKADELLKLQTQNEDRIFIEQLEITNNDDIDAVAGALKDKAVDLLILNAGILGGRDKNDAGGKLRKMGNLDRNDMMNVYNVNVVGPMLLGQALYENVKSSKRKQIIGITSGMGSISDCGSNSAVPYRCSKAAMNMAFQSFAKESESNKDGVHAMVLNPGWVQTDMGGKNASKPVHESVQQMLKVIDGYKTDKLTNGGFYNYSGAVYGW